MDVLKSFEVGCSIRNNLYYKFHFNLKEVNVKIKNYTMYVYYKIYNT